MKLHLLLCACALTSAAAATAHGQITSAEIERGLRYRHTTPYDGEPHTQRYSYGPGMSWFFNGNAAQLHYLDYLDRVDRAEKFGYAMPVNPFEEPMPRMTPTIRIGIGFGAAPAAWRRR